MRIANANIALTEFFSERGFPRCGGVVLPDRLFGVHCAIQPHVDILAICEQY